ncbi:DOPA 4,5-dioxygenase family protein [Novacetimonas pomaceti]|uniref:Aromatic ring-cleaving dioxygenase n=1 Tax=Novacetimonas pomaceti TaxID=2021998 RepID=A0A318Q725_9PROT|nr:DOPA 4,5-dioxygenase family protein [Novacetimonas pomaceti]PYD75446.1 aromatic ring-cleaving dioxygenase [Novacetimonas pomaceti]
MPDTSFSPRSVDEIASYHAHVYFSPATASHALALRTALARRFSVRLGRVHEAPVGPHRASMFQVAFETALFATLVPWLMLNRNGLSILVHPNTTHPRRDHVEDSLWLGTPLALLPERLPETQEHADMAGPVNTTPDLPPVS